MKETIKAIKTIIVFDSLKHENLLVCMNALGNIFSDEIIQTHIF